MHLSNLKFVNDYSSTLRFCSTTRWPATDALLKQIHANMLECRNGLQCQSRTESNQGEKRTFPSRRPRRPHLQIELGNASRKGVEFHLSEEHNVEHLTCRDDVVRVELQHCSRSTVRSAPRVGQEARACLRPCTTTAGLARLAQA
jgi:hypothetical protein